MGTNKTGSILIWSIFLVLFVTFSFLYISNGISKQIDKNKIKIQQLNNDVLIDNISGDNYKNTGLSNNENYELKFYNSFYGSLKKNEEINFGFSQTNTGSMEIKVGGPIFYKIYDSIGDYENGILTGTLDSIVLTGTSLQNKNLSLTNLGGIAEINIDFQSSSGIIFPYNYYKKVKNIGGIDIVKEVGSLK